MNHFPHRLVVTIDPSDQQRPSIGFVHQDMEIIDPFLSACGRFISEPFEYDLTYDQANELRQLNDAVTASTEKAIGHATDDLDKLLSAGGHVPKPGMLDATSAARHAIWTSLAQYVVAVINASHSSVPGTVPVNAESPVAPRIAPQGIEFVTEIRDAFPGVTAWWNAQPLPLGQVCVYGNDDDALGSPLWIESSKVHIRIFDLAGQLLSSCAVDGREGLNSFHEALVGYRPDDDSFEPDASKLLAQVCEIAYRHATGDAN